MRACLMCGSVRSKVLRVVERGNLPYRILSCEGCSFVFVGDVREDTADHESPPPPGFIPPYRRRHFQIRHLLNLLLPPDKTQLVAEVGCGHGVLGRMLSHDYTYVGFEPGRGRSDYARSLGLDVRTELFGAGSLAKPASAIILDNVLEHLVDPTALLDVATNSLRLGGYLIVLTPNRYDIRRFVPSFRDRHFWIPDQHVNYFRSKDLHRLLDKRGFETSPFGLQALTLRDFKYFPRAVFEALGIYPFGLNLYARRVQ